jgi:photosystem II stability/assembly factor-like uncharacterized protein
VATRKKTTRAKAKPPQRRQRQRKPRRGPGRWLDDDMLVLYEQAPAEQGAAAGGDTANKVASRGTGGALWRDAYDEFRRRRQQESDTAAAAVAAPAPGAAVAPMVPQGVNWLPLGPTVVMNGQTGGNERQPVAGRVAGLAIGPGGTVIYAASANGGVFRSLDGALSWEAMDQIDLDPSSPGSASLICGAIAMDPTNPRRVFVGTGEGATLFYYSRRVTGALPAYRGIGVLRTEDGGETWEVEPSDLAGQAFFALALHPADREAAVAATTAGLYRRNPQPGGKFDWVRVDKGVFSSVVSAGTAGAARFYAARWRQADEPAAPAVVWSADGVTWKRAGSAFPTNDVARIALAVQPNNPDLLYAFVTKSNGSVHGLYRLDGMAAAWKPVSGLPDVLPATLGQFQGNYDLALAVDPEKPDIVYLGGNCHLQLGGASVWRCQLAPAGTGWRVTANASIGQHAHSDVHALVHSPGNPNELWCASDGGVFLNRDPRGTGKFTAQNNGLACLCCNFIAQHPTDPSIVFTGLQDNGTALKVGSFWHHVQDGDGGYCVINWADPRQILVFSNGDILRSTTGGKTHEGWKSGPPLGWQTMTQPVVGLPYNPDPARKADAKRVATGVANRVYVSDDFGATWPAASTPSFKLSPSAGSVFALAFATRTRLFVGTTRGKVFRADEGQGGWTVTPLLGATGHLDVGGVITDVAVDLADNTRASIYVAFGGIATQSTSSAHVWWFDGHDWQPRSGTAPAGLLNVEHNALAIDPQNPNHIYVGADIGVWHSSDGGRSWEILQNGLPDAPVFDLQIHPTQRLLRAATHGRGIFEIPI